MRRLFSFFLISVLPLCAFANVEIDVMSTTTFPSYQFEGHDTQSASIPVGIECDFDFFFIPVNAIDFGLNFAGGSEYIMGESTIFGTIAPVVRYTLNEKHSFSFLIGAKHGYGFRSNSSEDSSFDTDGWRETLWYNAVTASFAYKHWFVNTDGLHFGINMGFGFDKLLSGSKSYYDLYENYYYFYDGSISYNTGYGYKSHDLVDGFVFRIFFGICFNCGDRAFDRNR